MNWVELHENEASRDTILVFTYANKKIRPQNCCVPKCTKKVYEENGMKISFHKFPEDKALFRKWIVAIRRDVGKDFKVTDHTRVCSWHFKRLIISHHLQILKPAAVPSVFSWKKGSPVKRKSPKKRNPIERKTSVEGSKTMTAEVTNVTFSSTCDLLSTVTEKEFETAEDFPSTDSKGEFSAGQTSVEDLELIIRNLNIEIERHKEENRKISILLNNLKLEVKELTRRNAAPQARVFSVDRCLESDKDVNFYTGFPGRFAFEKLCELQYVTINVCFFWCESALIQNVATLVETIASSHKNKSVWFSN